MQGYILNINRVKDEDLIVTILTENRVKTLYRFYGARHSNINVGYKIDFTIQSNPKSKISLLREVLHLGENWITNPKRFFIWQIFIKLLFSHLKDITKLDNFYFELLENMSKKISKQNPMRVAIEAYTNLLEFEGRLHDDFLCFICEESIKHDLILTRGFLPAHKKCIYSSTLDKKKIQNLFKTKSTLYLDDNCVEKLWHIIQEGF